MASKPSELSGKVILVTGAAKRIGRGIALRLTAEGARGLVHYGESEQAARELGLPVYQANLEKGSEIAEMFLQIQRQAGLLDGLVNNAARSTRVDPLDITAPLLHLLHSANLTA